MRRYPFGKYILDIPDDHRIIDIHRENYLYDRTYGIIIEEISNASPEGMFVDIGANIGDTAAFFASVAPNPILCIEGNEVFLQYLRANERHLGGQVTVLEKFVRTNALANVKLGYAHGTGTGYMTVDAGRVVERERFVSISDILSFIQERSSNIALFKTDTDGMDGYIIADAIEAIDAPLFFECDTIAILPDVENPWPGVFRSLEEKGYGIIAFDNHGLPMLITNNAQAQILSDLAGYIHLQRAIHPVRIHYLDIWGFPPAWRPVFERVATILRDDLLRPYRF